MNSYLKRKKKALLMGSGGWWMPPNFNPDDCLAAYQFKGAADAATSLSDLTGHGYTLTKTDPDNLMDFDPNEGWIWARNAWRGTRALDNSAINKSENGIKSFLLRFKNMGGNSGHSSGFHLSFDGNSEYPKGWCIDIPEWNDFNGWHVAVRRFYKNTGWPGVWTGIIQCNFSFSNIYDQTKPEIYVDGVRIPDNDLGSFGNATESPNSTLFGHVGAAGNLTSQTMIAGAFYSRWLTETEIAHVYEQVASM